MKKMPPHSSDQSRQILFDVFKAFKLLTAVLALAGLPSVSHAQSVWNGSTSTDWNTAANWSAGVPTGVNADITTTNPRIATITSTISATPVDIRLGIGASTTGRVDHIAGSASTGSGNWLILGWQGGQATYNLANTATTGGAFTGYGQGSGSVTAGAIQCGFDNGTLSTLNINSSGTVAANFLCIGANGAPTSTVNIDNGNININGDAQIGGNQYNQSSGISKLNMSGGTLTANLIVLSRGNNNASVMQGTANLTGGTLNSRSWFTLGFAGSATAFAGLTNSGATINVNTNGGGNLEMTVFDPMSAVFIQNSGALNLCNSAYISFGNGGNNSGTATFNHNGGTVTFYSDVATTVGGTGYLNLGNGGSTGTYTYNLNGGTLAVPKIEKTASGASGTFNFNGGTLKPTGSTTTFMSFLTAANVNAGGAIIDTAGYNITVVQTLQNGGGGLTKLGAGTLTLGAYNYTGPTVVKAGTLALDATQTSSGSDIAVTNAALTVLTGNGGSSLGAANLIFSGTTTNSFDFGTATAPTAAPILATGVTQAGTTVINITGNFLVVGTYPLISTGGSVPTTGFSLGSLPAGVVAHLSNSGTSLDLVITAAGQNLNWYGADSLNNPLTTWNINTSSNWNTGTKKYLQYAGNSYGDNVTFDDSVFAGSTSVNLGVRVVPATVTFNSTQPYSLSGAGGIDGSTSLQIGNTGPVSINTSNNFTGGTAIASGSTLLITNNSALGATAGGVNIAGGTLQINGTTTGSRAVNITASSTLTAGNGAAVQLSGGLTNTAASSFNAAASSSLQLNGPVATTGDITFDVGAGGAGQFGGLVTGTGGLTKTGNGTLTFAGAYSAGGAFLMNGGTSVVSSAVAPGGSEVWVGSGSGNSAAMNVNAGGTLTANNWLVLGRNDGTGTLNVNGGTVSNTANNVTFANTAAAIGTLNLNSGSIWANNEVWIGENGNATGNQTGGDITSGAWFVVGRNSGSVGTYNLSGGTVTAATTGFGSFGVMGSFSGAQGTLNVSGGSYTVGGSRRLYVGEAGTGTLNVSGAGTVTCSNTPDGGIRLGALATGVGTVNLDGGTIRAALISQGTGSGTFNFNGGTLRAVQSNAGFMTGLARANVRNGGAVFDTAGSDITVGQILDHSNIGGDNATDGGLTKIGNGALYLNGANTYTGPTVVNAGLLGGTGTIAGSVTVNSGGGLAPGNSIGTLTVVGNVTLNANSTNVFEVDGTTPANDQVIAAGSVTYGGVLKIVPTGSFTVGQQFQLFSGTSATNASNFASVQSTTATTFSFTNGVLRVLTSIASNPTNITFGVSGNTLSLSWPADHLGWTLYTNIAGVAATNQWYPLPGSSSVTSTNLTINPNRTNVFFRLQQQ